jgi:hypothetical protein
MFMPRTLANLVDKVARASVGKDWSLYAALLEHWPEIVGPDYARVATPVKLVFPHQPLEPRRRNGTLTVRLPKGLAMEFTFKLDRMKQRINDYFGYDAVGKIALDPIFAMPKPPSKVVKAEPDAAIMADLNQQTKTVDNDEIRNALVSFGASFVNKKPGD